MTGSTISIASVGSLTILGKESKEIPVYSTTTSCHPLLPNPGIVAILHRTHKTSHFSYDVKDSVFITDVHK